MDENTLKDENTNNSCELNCKFYPNLTIFDNYSKKEINRKYKKRIKFNERYHKS